MGRLSSPLRQRPPSSHAHLSDLLLLQHLRLPSLTFLHRFPPFFFFFRFVCRVPGQVDAEPDAMTSMAPGGSSPVHCFLHAESEE
eukprot:2642580-Rhodomonas_salina.1